MDRTIWIERLAELVRPRSPKAAVNRMVGMLPALHREPEHLFSDDSLIFVAARVKQTPSYGDLKALLDQYARQHQPGDAPPRPERSMPELQQERDARQWEERKAWLRRDWDDPAAILRKVQDCQGNVMMLRLLGKLVRQWAPQHLGFLPPRILEAIETDAEIAPADLHLRFADETPPEGTRSVAEQLDALRAGTRPQAYHLDPATLDRINPLPNGGKRA